ncbi:MAG: cell division protein FtsL [Defluviitaleaceae bacterium]|nr:cell division protein FtsL [Defluviitaleaceae bacterium]
MSRRNSYADYYSYTSEAFQPLHYEPEPRKRMKKIRKPKLRYRDVGQTSRMFSLLSLITLLIMFAAAIGIVMSSALVVERQQNIRALTSELRQIEEDNNLIRTQISLSYDIHEIERIAGQRLTMGRPQPHQIVHIYVPRTSQIITNIEHVQETPRRSILDVLRNWR